MSDSCTDVRVWKTAGGLERRRQIQGVEEACRMTFNERNYSKEFVGVEKNPQGDTNKQNNTRMLGEQG